MADEIVRAVEEVAAGSLRQAQATTTLVSSSIA